MLRKYPYIISSFFIVSQLCACGGGEDAGGGMGEKTQNPNRTLEAFDVSHFYKKCPDTEKITNKVAPSQCLAGTYNGASRPTKHPHSINGTKSCNLTIYEDGQASMAFGDIQTPKFTATEDLFYKKRHNPTFKGHWEIIAGASSLEKTKYRHMLIDTTRPTYTFNLSLSSTGHYIDMQLISIDKEVGTFMERCYVPILRQPEIHTNF